MRNPTRVSGSVPLPLVVGRHSDIGGYVCLLSCRAWGLGFWPSVSCSSRQESKLSQSFTKQWATRRAHTHMHVLYISIYTHAYIYINIIMYMYMYIYMYINAFVCSMSMSMSMFMYLSMSMSVSMSVYMDMDVYIKHMYVCMSIYVYAYVFAYVYVYVYVYTRVYTRLYTHTHTYQYMRTISEWRLCFHMHACNASKTGRWCWHNRVSCRGDGCHMLQFVFMIFAEWTRRSTSWSSTWADCSKAHRPRTSTNFRLGCWGVGSVYPR